MLHERLLELERLCHQEKALLAGKFNGNTRHSSCSSLEANLPPSFAEAHNRMLAWLHTQRRLLPQPKYITCLSTNSAPFDGRNDAIVSGVTSSKSAGAILKDTQQNNGQFQPLGSTSCFSHNNSSIGRGNITNYSCEPEPHAPSCKRRGIHYNHSGQNSLPDQGSMSSEDNRSPLTPNCMKRSLTSEEHSLNRSRQVLYPNESSMPNTPSLSPNIRSPSILKRVDSSPKLAQTTSVDSTNERFVSQQPTTNPSHMSLPKRSIIKRRTVSQDKDKYPEIELLRSSPDGCSRGHSFSAKLVTDNHANDHAGDYPTNNRKYSNVIAQCSNCQSTCGNSNDFSAHCHPNRHVSTTEPSTPKNVNMMICDDEKFSPMLKSCEEMLSEQRIRHRSLSEEANKTLEAVENDLRELCNLPRAKYYKQKNSELECTIGNNDPNAYFNTTNVPKSKFTRQRGSFKRNADKSSKYNFDRTRSAVDLTAKDQDSHELTHDPQTHVSSTQLGQSDDRKGFSSHNIESIGRSASAKSLHIEDTSNNVNAVKNSPVFNYCTSSLPKRRTIRTFRNSIETVSPKTNRQNLPRDQLTSTLNETVGQVINYGLEDLVKQHDLKSHHRRQSLGNALSNNYSSLPYSSVNKSSLSNPPSSRSSLRRENTIHSEKDFQHQQQQQGISTSTDQLSEYPYSHSPPATPCSHSLQYYQERVPEAYNPENRVSGMSRSMSFRYSNHRSPSGHSPQSCRTDSCSQNNQCISPGQYYYNQCPDKKCGVSSRSLATTPLDDQKDINIPNYFSNNSKGSSIPTSLMPRHQIYKNEQHSYSEYNCHLPGREKNHPSTCDHNARHSVKLIRYQGACNHGCSHEHQQNSGYPGNCYKKIEYNVSNNQLVSQQMNSSNASACCVGDISRPYSFPTYRSECPNSTHFHSSIHDSHDSSNTMRTPHYKNEEVENFDNTPTTWSWEQRIADVEKSYVPAPVWNSSRQNEHSLGPPTRYSSAANEHDVHSKKCDHFHNSSEVRSRGLERQAKVQVRRRSFSKELAELAFGGPPRRTINCIPTNLVRNALGNHDPSYKLLKQDPDDDQSEAGASSIDMTPYRYAQ